MEVDILYGKEKIKINACIPFKIVLPNKVKVDSEEKVVKKAFEKPVGKSLEKFLNESERILVIVNDATRPTPTSKILKYLLPKLSSHPDIKLLVATGTHRAPTEEEYRSILEETYDTFRKKTVAHDAKKEEDMIYLGRSKRGTEMYINKLVLEYRNILVINSVEPHYFAGFTGGRKSFLPGVASYKTVEMNHRLALDEKACSLVLKGNPVHEDMVELLHMLKDLNIFSIQIVLTGDEKIYKIATGDLERSFDLAAEYAKEVFCVPIEDKGNIVITVAPHPMDIDLYQSQKALDNGKYALEEGGVIILVSKCWAGIGEKTFLDLLGMADSCKEVLEIIKKEYKLGYHKAAKIAELGLKAEMWAVTDLDDSIIRKAKMKPYKDLQEALDDAINLIKSKGKKPNLIIMPAGSLTIPIIKKGVGNGF